MGTKDGKRIKMYNFDVLVIINQEVSVTVIDMVDELMLGPKRSNNFMDPLASIAP